MGYIFILMIIAGCLLFYCLMFESKTISVRYHQNRLFHVDVQNVLAFLFVLALLLLSALRGDEIGNDTHSYKSIFIRQITGGTFSRSIKMEYGYQLFALIVGRISQNRQAIIIATSIFIYVLIYLYMRRYSVSPLICCVFFFVMSFGASMNIIRQVMAIAVLCFAYEAIEHRHTVLSLLLIALAATFHMVSLLMLVYVIVRRFRFQTHWIVIISIAIFAVCMLEDSLAARLAIIFPQYSSYLLGSRSGSGWMGVIYHVSRIVVVSLFYYLGTEPNERTNGTKWLIILACWVAMFGFVNNQFTRASGILSTIMFVPIINEMLSSNKKYRSILIVLMYLILCLYWLIQLVFRPEWNLIYPYEFFFEASGVI